LAAAAAVAALAALLLFAWRRGADRAALAVATEALRSRDESLSTTLAGWEETKAALRTQIERAVSAHILTLN